MLLLMAGVVVVVLALFSALWLHEKRSNHDARELSAAAMRELAREGLLSRGQTLSSQLADAATNPMYYLDLAKLGELARATLRQPDVVYVVIHDAQGQVVHDGSGDIPAFGQPMSDPMAYEALNAKSVHGQWSDKLLDVASPIHIGGQRIGGVRVGLSRDSANRRERDMLEPLAARLQAASNEHLAWIVSLLVALAAIGVGAMVLLQRRIVAPISGLAEAAARIEQGRYAEVQVQSNRQDEIGELVRAFSRMSESVARHDRDIRRMAYTDSLTGLSNRLAFREALDDRLMTLQASSGELALLFVDLDDFKRVNDTLGHEAGDEVLGQLSMRIRMAVERLGGAGAEIARFGGDEFIVLFMAEDIRSSSGLLAEALIEEIQRPLVLRGRQVFLGASVGITLFPFDATGASQLLKSADIAMYQAKVAGKGCYRFYSKAMDQAVERRVQLEEELRGAWDRGELSLHYQPIYRLADRRLMGAEALCRWQHPKLGVVPPSVFIEVAEQSGLIEALGRHVLLQACKDAADWTQPGMEPPFVSVNISPRQLRTGDLPDVVASALAATGVLPRQLHVELTETAVLGDEVQASALLSRLRATGVKVWLDDFGTGFSGLSHLRRVPVDGVKIDRSFVADVLRDPDDLALTSAIIAMAHSLGITVVAEGIEAEGQYEVLRERGCDQGQGFWLGRPMTAADILRCFRD
ncbi:MAG: EAL domain-containing protein [Arenimonas sp.]|nr:EAL domain-containing protein [Arenimonas sp.]